MITISINLTAPCRRSLWMEEKIAPSSMSASVQIQAHTKYNYENSNNCD